MIYFLHDLRGNAVKIGYTGTITSLHKRIRELQVGNPRKLELWFTIPGDKKLERLLHKKLKKHNVSGEWFHCSFTVVILAIDLYRRAKAVDPDNDLIA